MRALVRLMLLTSVTLMSGGVGVAPHEDPGKPRLHVDHPPAASRIVLLEHLAHLAPAAQHATRGGHAGHLWHLAHTARAAAVEEREADPALSPQGDSPMREAAVPAAVNRGRSRLWRPGRRRIARLANGVLPRQCALRTAHGPPREPVPTDS